MGSKKKKRFINFPKRERERRKEEGKCELGPWEKEEEEGAKQKISHGGRKILFSPSSANLHQEGSISYLNLEGVGSKKGTKIPF